MSEEAKKIPEPESIKTPEIDKDVKSQLPVPTGWKILIAMPKADEKTEGGIIKATSTVQDEEISNICGYVLKLGPECYNDTKRFPNGAWCNEGDWVCIGRYAGSRFQIEGGEVRIINDDEVIATIVNPDDIKTYGA